MATGKRPDGEVFASGANEGEVLDFPAISRGWGVTTDGKDGSGNKVTDPTNGIPPMEWFNALLKRIDEAILWMLQNSWPDWVAGTWPVGATVVNNGFVWRALKETSGAPAEDNGDWLELFPLANLDKRYLGVDKDGEYLHVDQNLSDVDDAEKSLKNIGGFPSEGGTVGSKGVLSPFLFANSNSATLDKQGSWIEWNRSGGQGELNLICNRGKGEGGHEFITVSEDGQTITSRALVKADRLELFQISPSGDAGKTNYSPSIMTTIPGRGAQDFSEGAAAVLRMVEQVDNLAYAEILCDGFGAVHSFKFDQNGRFHADDQIFAGAAFMATDGNLYGTCWGGYLNNWVSSQIGAAVNPKVAGIGLGARVKVTSLGGSADWNGQVPVGAVLIAALTEGDDRITGAYYSYLMYNVNGNWVNAGQVG